MAEFRLGKELEGMRLDQALAKFYPELGIRARRRLVANRDLLLNGHHPHASTRIKKGDLLHLPEKSGENENAAGAFLLGLREPYCFFYKSAGLHTAHVAESGNPSLEAALGSLAPEKYIDNIRLLQRLDFGTSGIVAAALSQEAADKYRQWEKDGQTGKYYLAFLEGRLEKPILVDRALDTAKRRKSHVLEHKSERYTLFKPLAVWEKGDDFPLPGLPFPQGPFTLAGCQLSSGQRHQIRAHAAWLGHPLVGDELYGKGTGGFILQHCALAFPGHSIQLGGEESIKAKMPASVQKAVDAWLAEKMQAHS